MLISSAALLFMCPQGRGGGHIMYERRIPPMGHKQLLVLPCTPSDVNSIETTHARLQKMDREAAEVQRRAKAAQQLRDLTHPQGGNNQS